LSGLSYPAGEDVSVWVNGHFIAAIEAVPGSSNWFIFHLDTAQANEGLHIVVAQTQSVTTAERFVLDNTEPVRQPTEGPVFDDAPVFQVPAGVAFSSHGFLPFITNP